MGGLSCQQLLGKLRFNAVTVLVQNIVLILDAIVSKQPYCTRPAEEPLRVFAGLYAYWQDPQGEGIDSCTILVNVAAASVAAIHDSLPLCLAPVQFDEWLDLTEQALDHLQALIDGAQAPA